MLLAKQAIAKQMDQAADVAELSVAQIQANNAMNRMTAMMAQSSRTMSRAQKNMNPEKVRRPFPLSSRGLSPLRDTTSARSRKIANIVCLPLVHRPS